LIGDRRNVPQSSFFETPSPSPLFNDGLHADFVRVPLYDMLPHMAQDYRDVVTQEPGKRGGRPCIRGMRITVADILGWLAAGMSNADIIVEYPELTENDIRAALAYAADKERRIVTALA
jgi:uncharacterized protein (DUF433 family)